MEMRRRGKVATRRSSIQRTLHYLISDPTRNIAPTRMARPALMTRNGFWPAPQNGNVGSNHAPEPANSINRTQSEFPALFFPGVTNFLSPEFEKGEPGIIE